MAGFGLDINNFFDSLIPIVEIKVSFIQLDPYCQVKAVSEVSDEYVLVENGDGVEFFQNCL